MKRDAHTLKSSSANVGATVVFQMAKSLEAECETNNSEDNLTIITDIKRNYDRTKKELSRELV